MQIQVVLQKDQGSKFAPEFAGIYAGGPAPVNQTLLLAAVASKKIDLFIVHLRA